MSERSLGDTAVRPQSAGVRITVVDDHTLCLAMDRPCNSQNVRITDCFIRSDDDMRLEGVLVDDVRLHGEGQREFVRLRPVVNQCMRNKVPGFVRDVWFRNVAVEGSPGEYLVQIEGADATHDVRDARFENVSILGSPLTRQSPQVRVGPHAQDIRFGSQTQSAR